jgi:DNA-binding IclR family transcriptional regulator
MVHPDGKPPGPPGAAVQRIAAALGVVADRGWVSAAELAAALDIDRSTGWRLAR